MKKKYIEFSLMATGNERLGITSLFDDYTVETKQENEVDRSQKNIRRGKSNEDCLILSQPLGSLH
jgi:hypothetical protein